jgi:Xaa-Pro aminopeptidase
MRLSRARVEIAVREATRISGLGIMEAVRSAEPGMFDTSSKPSRTMLKPQRAGHRLSRWCGRKNASWPHYHAAQTRTEDGQLCLRLRARLQVLHRRRHADVLINGKFTADQKELYTILPAAVSGADDVDSTCRVSDILKDVVKKMDAVMASYTFTNPKYGGATRFVDNYRRSAEAGTRSR